MTEEMPAPDRLHIYAKGSRGDQKAYFARAAAIKAAALEERRRLARDYIAAAEDSLVNLDPQVAVASSLAMIGAPMMNDVLAECRRLLNARATGTPLRSKGSLDYFANGADFPADGAVVAFALSPQVVAPIAAYFDALPVLLNAFITRASASEMIHYSSHSFHLDPGDVRQIKVFIHLTDVDTDCGPFHALPAEFSDRVLASTGYLKGRLTDEAVEESVGAGHAFASVGPAGTVTFCDTSRCFHFGGRPAAPGKPVRELLVLHYTLPTSTWHPLREGDGPPPVDMAHLQACGDPVHDALIGRRLVY